MGHSRDGAARAQTVGGDDDGAPHVAAWRFVFGACMGTISGRCEVAICVLPLGSIIVRLAELIEPEIERLCGEWRDIHG